MCIVRYGSCLFLFLGLCYGQINWVVSSARGPQSSAATWSPLAITLSNTPLTTRGDLLVARTATPIIDRLAKGSQYQTLQGGASDLGWDAVHLDQVTAVTGILPLANLPTQTGTGNIVLSTSPAITTDIHCASAGGCTLGTAALPAGSVYIGAAATNNIRLTGTASAARTVTFPDASINVPGTNIANTFIPGQAINTTGAGLGIFYFKNNNVDRLAMYNAPTPDTFVFSYYTTGGAYVGDILTMSTATGAITVNTFTSAGDRFVCADSTGKLFIKASACI